MSELSDAIAKSVQKNPLLGLPQGQQAEGLSAQLAAKKKISPMQLKSSVATQEQRGANVDASDAAPVTDFLQHTYNTLETPLSLTGALMLGHERDVQQGRPESLMGGYGGQTMQNARRLLSQGKLGELAQRYSTTSLAANKARAEAGDKGAQYFQKHPSQFGALAFGEEFVNPGNIITGKLGEFGGGLAKAGLTGVGKTLARGEGMGGRFGRAAGEVMTGNRFGELRQGAADQALKHGVNPKLAANQADLAGRALATAPESAAHTAQKITKSVFKDLTKDEQLEVVDRAEGMKAKPYADPKQEALVAQRVAAYKHYRVTLDAMTKQAGYSDPSMMEKNYFPRKGATTPPGRVEGPTDTITNRRPAGPTLRKDTLELERAFKSRQQSIFHGRYNQLWDPAQTLQEHVQSRMENVLREQSYKKLANLGLIEPPKLDSYGHPVPQSPDFLPVDPMGSPTLNGAKVHPSVGALIKDVTPNPSTAGVLANPGHLAASGLRNVNRAFAKLQVSNPLYHPVVNVSQNIAAQVLKGNVNPIEFMKGLVAKTPSEAIASGADIPYAEPGSISDTLRPWKDLNKSEKLERAKKAPGNLGSEITNRLLYKHIQPRMAEASYRGMKGKLGPEGAALKTRQILGEPENLPPSLEGAANSAMFPHWVSAMFRYWPQALGETPALYMAPHSGVNARNLSRGKGPDSFDFSKLIPGIVTGKAKDGNNITVSPPSPADRSIEAIDVLGNALTGNLNPKSAASFVLNMLNPALALGVRAIETAKASPMEMGSQRLWDKDAPPGSQLAEIGKMLAQRYAPTRGNPTNPLDALSGLVGLNPSEQPSDARRKWLTRQEYAIREGGKRYPGAPWQYGIEEIRSKIAAAQKANQSTITLGKQQMSVKAAEKLADAWYNYMQKLETNYGGQ